MRKNTNFISIQLVIALVLINCIFLIIMFTWRNSSSERSVPNESKVCMTQGAYQELVSTSKTCILDDKLPKQQVIRVTQSVDRDERVLKDPLYPPLNREERHLFNQISQRDSVHDQQQFDTFRLLGYLKSVENEKDAGGNTWKLFGRMKDRHVGEFYMSPANTSDDVKIPITGDIVIGERLRDIYTIPSELQFKSPLLNKGKYVLIELPKNDITSIYR